MLPPQNLRVLLSPNVTTVCINEQFVFLHRIVSANRKAGGESQAARFAVADWRALESAGLNGQFLLNARRPVGAKQHTLKTDRGRPRKSADVQRFAIPWSLAGIDDRITRQWSGNRWCRRQESNLHGDCSPRDFKSHASTIPPRRHAAGTIVAPGALPQARQSQDFALS